VSQARPPDPGRSSQAGRESRPPRLAPLALAGLLGFFLWQFLAKSLLFLRSPFSPDYGEGQVLALIQRMQLDGTFFGDVQRYPMVLSTYAPLFMLVNVPGYQLFGPTLLQPRLVSLLAALAVSGFLFALLRRRTGDARVAGALALVFFAPWFVQTWAAMARVDMLAQMLTMSGLYAFDRLWPRGGLRRYVPFLLFGAAFYTRQTTLVAPAAVLGSLLLEPGRRRDLPRALAAFVVPTGAVLLVMTVATRGQAWLHLVPYAAAAGYDLAHMARSYGSFLLLAGPLVLLVLAGLVRRPGALLRGPNLPLALFWILSLAALSTIAKEGAGQNYFVEPFLATLLLAGIALGALVDAGDVPRRAWPLAVLVAAAAAGFVDYDHKRLHQAIRAPERARAFIELDRMVKATEGPILSENLSVVVTNRKRAWVEPWSMMLLAKKGLWRPDVLVGDCRRGLFGLVVTETRLREIPGISECLDDAYEPVADLGPYQVFRPKPRAGPCALAPAASPVQPPSRPSRGR
jgi:Dolichyl-phosphate-mannose-protein mannosyltransferase